MRGPALVGAVSRGGGASQPGAGARSAESVEAAEEDVATGVGSGSAAPHLLRTSDARPWQRGLAACPADRRRRQRLRELEGQVDAWFGVDTDTPEQPNPHRLSALPESWTRFALRKVDHGWLLSSVPARPRTLGRGSSAISTSRQCVPVHLTYGWPSGKSSSCSTKSCLVSTLQSWAAPPGVATQLC